MEREQWNSFHLESLKDPEEMIETIKADAKVNYPVKQFLEELISQKNSSQEDPILDLGTSPFSFTYLPRKRKVVFVDWAERAFGGPFMQNQNGRVLADVRRLPFPSGFFPIVLSKQVYHYLPDPDSLLHEMVRVLKPGGLFILIDGEYVRALVQKEGKEEEFSKRLKLKPQEVAQKLILGGLQKLRTQRLCIFEVETPASISKLALTAVYGEKANCK